MFDSSHFPPGTAVNVRYRVWCPELGWVEENSGFDPVVQNRLMMFQDPHPLELPAPNPVPAVQSLFTGRNYNLWPRDDVTWTKENYYLVMGQSTAIYYAGHGTPAYHTAPNPPWDGITVTRYGTERAADIGTGLPPFNSTSSSSIFFCHLQACKCGTTDNFEVVLYPYYMGWGGVYLENQAVLAYSAYLLTTDRINNAYIVWPWLAHGYTARSTWAWIRDEYLPTNAYGLQVSDSGESSVDDWRTPTIGDFNLICGPDNGAARLKTVYTGDQVLPLTSTNPWYRPL